MAFSIKNTKGIKNKMNQESLYYIVVTFFYYLNKNINDYMYFKEREVKLKWDLNSMKKIS